jgi:uncharacterized membrane protein
LTYAWCLYWGHCRLFNRLIQTVKWRWIRFDFTMKVNNSILTKWCIYIIRFARMILTAELIQYQPNDQMK